jgi:hypothetical protein
MITGDIVVIKDQVSAANNQGTAVIFYGPDNGVLSGDGMHRA